MCLRLNYTCGADKTEFAGLSQDSGAVIKRELEDEMTVSRARPAKRARFDGVFVPPRPRTLEDYLHARLREVPAHPVTLDSTISDVRVPRQFLSTYFGGSNRNMFVTLSPENRRKHGHGYPHFLFPKAEKNYTVPRTPGVPGLMFLAQWEKVWAEGPQKVLVGLQHSQWRYMGEYNLVRSERMSPAEFNALPGRVSGPEVHLLHRSSLMAYDIIGPRRVGQDSGAGRWPSLMEAGSSTHSPIQAARPHSLCTRIGQRARH